MKIKTSTGRKIRYGGTSIALTALIIAVVIILNAIMTLLTKRFMWYGDLTPDLHFTLSQDFFDLIGKVDSEDDIDTPIEMVNKFRAENKAYNLAMSYLATKREHLAFMIDAIDKFDIHSQKQCIHNLGYIESVSNEEHPRYNKKITTVKSGTTYYNS